MHDLIQWSTISGLCGVFFKMVPRLLNVLLLITLHLHWLFNETCIWVPMLCTWVHFIFIFLGHWNLQLKWPPENSWKLLQINFVHSSIYSEQSIRNTFLTHYLGFINNLLNNNKNNTSHTSVIYFWKCVKNCTSVIF